MKCEDFDKLLHLYLDGETDEEKSKEIEEHLLVCQRCQGKLQELKNLEEQAKRIRMPEPTSAYWKTFTEEVRNKIILRRRKSLWAKIKSGWESFFFYSPVKLRIAAGIASILLVFIIGKLYWDYRGKELERVKSERMEKVLTAPAQQKSESPAPAVKESLQTKELSKETAFVKPGLSAIEQKVVKSPARSESASPAPKKGVEEEKTKGTGEAKTQIPKPSITSTAEVAKIEEGAATKLKLATQVELATPPPSVQETTIQIQKLQAEKGAVKMNAKQAVTPKQMGKEFYLAESTKFYKVDKAWVRTLAEKDTSIEADTLKKVITSWKEFFEKKPVSEWIPEGFSQIKIAHQLLFLKTRDQSLLQEGIELLNKYEESIADQKTKDELSKKITELEALKKK